MKRRDSAARIYLAKEGAGNEVIVAKPSLAA